MVWIIIFNNGFFELNTKNFNLLIGFGRIKVRWLLLAYFLICAVEIIVIISGVLIYFETPFIRDFGPVFISSALLMVAMFFFCWKSNIDSKRLFLGSWRSWNHWRWIGLIVPLYLFNESADWVVFSGISWFSSSLANRLFDFQGIQRPITLITFACFVVLVALNASAEEMFFRSVLLHRFAYKWGCRGAVIVSSIVFACLNVNCVSYFIFGLVLALVYLKTRTLLIPIVIHALYNAIVFLWPDGIRILTGFRNSWMLNVFFLIASAAVLFAVIRRCWPPPDQSLPYYDEKMGQPTAGESAPPA